MPTAKMIKPTEIAHVARLANLPISQEEIDTYTQNLSTVLAYISKINGLSTEEVPETNQVTGLTNIFRQDEIDTSRILSQAQALSNARQTHNGFFVVSAVINQ